MTNHNHESEHHHVLPDKMAFFIGGTLLFLTIVTVWVAGHDFGRFNFLIAMLIASVKALLVALFFMNLIYDHRENSVIFGASFVFLAIFLVLTAADLLYRGDVYVKGPLLASGADTFQVKNPWISTPELLSKGKETFQTNCTSCHGTSGHGDGSAAGGMKPPPRNFTNVDGWKNGRKISQIFKTIDDGIPDSMMSSFAYLSPSTKWALAHFVVSFGPAPEKVTAKDLLAIGVDPDKDEPQVEKKAPSIPIEVAMRHIIQEAVDSKDSNVGGSNLEPFKTSQTPGLASSRGTGRFFQTKCAQCHGSYGEGRIRIQNLGVQPKAYVVTRPWSGNDILKSETEFQRVVAEGLPGTMMPGFGQLSGSELRDLHTYVKGIVQVGGGSR